MNAPAELLRACADLSPLVRAHFLAQCAHESAAFTVLRENLNYSAAALRRVFPKYFTDAEAVLYARHPDMVADRVYANRMGNGNEASGDGFRFMGRGYIQLTGRDNYTRFSRAHFHDDRAVFHPELLESPEHAAAAARWYWDSHKITPMAERDNVRGVTLAINGGTNGLSDRMEWLDKFKAQMEAAA